MASANPLILTKFRAAIDGLYGNRVERVVLFGRLSAIAKQSCDEIHEAGGGFNRRRSAFRE